VVKENIVEIFTNNSKGDTHILLAYKFFLKSY